MEMTNEQIEAQVAHYDKLVAGKEAASVYEVADRIDLCENAQLVHVHYGDGKTWWGLTSVVAYDCGDVFCLTFWVPYPIESEDIADLEWAHAQTGRLATIFNGLPRLF